MPEATAPGLRLLAAAEPLLPKSATAHRSAGTATAPPFAATALPRPSPGC